MNMSCREVGLLVIDVLLSFVFIQGTSDFFSNPVFFCRMLCLYYVDWNCEIFYVFNSSRTKNMMWYGVLGTKELVQKTYKNLEQRVQLEVWAQRMKDADIRAFLSFWPLMERESTLCAIYFTSHTMNDALPLCMCTCTCTVHPCKWSWFHVSNVVLRSYTSCNLSLFLFLSLCAVWWSAHVLAESSGPCCFEHPQLCRRH